jgi:hypothetical protein
MLFAQSAGKRRDVLSGGLRRSDRRRQVRSLPFVVCRLLNLVIVRSVRLRCDAQAGRRVVHEDRHLGCAAITLPLDIVTTSLIVITTNIVSHAVHFVRGVVLTIVGSAPDAERVLNRVFRLLETVRSLAGLRSLCVARTGEARKHALIGSGKRSSGVDNTGPGSDQVIG